MANTSRVNGFKPVKHLNGSPYNGQATMYQVNATDATALFVGDMVCLDLPIAPTTDLNNSPVGLRAIQRGIISTPLVGAIVGFKVTPTDLNAPQQYRAASTLRYAMVADSPDLIFECEANQTTTATLVGVNCEVSVAAGSTATGNSGMTADMTLTGTTNTSPLKIMDIVQRPDNVVGTYNKILVKINNHSNGSLGNVGAS